MKNSLFLLAHRESFVFIKTVFLEIFMSGHLKWSETPKKVVYKEWLCMCVRERILVNTLASAIFKILGSNLNH